MALRTIDWSPKMAGPAGGNLHVTLNGQKSWLPHRKKSIPKGGGGKMQKVRGTCKLQNSHLYTEGGKCSERRKGRRVGKIQTEEDCKSYRVAGRISLATMIGSRVKKRRWKSKALIGFLQGNGVTASPNDQGNPKRTKLKRKKRGRSRRKQRGGNSKFHVLIN